MKVPPPSYSEIQLKKSSLADEFGLESLTVESDLEQENVPKRKINELLSGMGKHSGNIL